MLGVARQRASQQGADITFALGDAHALAFPDQSFDAVVSLRVLMHTPQWRTCLGELCRVARQRVVLDYPSIRSAAAIQASVRRVVHRLGVSTEPYAVFSDDQIASALERLGFRVRTRHRQFVLPITLHKAIGSRTFTERTEHFLERACLRQLFGSPVTIVAERCAPS